MAMPKMNVRGRLFVVLGVLIVATLTVGLVGQRALKQANDDLNEVYSINLASVLHIGRIVELRNENVRAYDLAIMSGDREHLEAYRATRERNNPLMEQLWQRYLALPATPEERGLAEQFLKRLEEYRAVISVLSEKLEAGDYDEARKLRVEVMQPRLEAMFETSGKLIALQDQVAREVSIKNQQNYRRSLWISWTAMAVAVGLAVLFGYLLTSLMLRALNSAVTVAENIASGRLGNQIDVTTADEFARLLNAMKEMDVRLSDIVSAVHQGAASVGSAARQISSGNDDLSQRTQEQASALEETASSMEEMTATVKQNADNARQASLLASSARDQADRGGNVLNRAVSAMGEINESSRRIADIISVIDAIAFQTNLLALNAAVEAARRRAGP